MHCHLGLIAEPSNSSHNVMSFKVVVFMQRTVTSQYWQHRHTEPKGSRRHVSDATGHTKGCLEVFHVDQAATS